MFLRNVFIRIVTQLGADMHTMPTYYTCYHAGIFLTQVYSCSVIVHALLVTEVVVARESSVIIPSALLPPLSLPSGDNYGLV